MPRITEQARESQMELVWLRVKQSPHGITEKEIADATGINQRTVNNYLRSLADEGKVEKQKGSRLWFMGDYQEIRSLKLEVLPEEAYTYYLGSRLFVKQQDKRNRLAETALMKLADALAANQLVGHEIAQAARELAQRPGAPKYETIFQTIVRGYLQRKQVALTYKPLDGQQFETVFDTYLLEPSAIGYATYLIGHSHLPDKLRAYKLERIESAEILDKFYSIPDGFPGLEILRNSWSIIIGEATVKVVLRFSPVVTARVLETQWHPSQDHCDDPEKPGWLCWWVHVADTMDMEPWIRAWGADVEVLEPGWLRQKMQVSIENQALLYQLAFPTSQIDSTLAAYQILWAKADKKTYQIHRLVYHMIDVGQTALVLWQNALPTRLKIRIAAWLELNVDAAGRLIAFWASLHDLGKASPAFQDHTNVPKTLRQRLLLELGNAGFKFGIRGSETHARHEVISTWSLRGVNGEGWLAEVTGLPTELADNVAQMLGGHHGAFPEGLKFSPTQLRSADKGDHPWSEARRALAHEMMTIFQPPHVQAHTSDTLIDNTILTLIAGIISAADWLGSDDENFPFEREALPLPSYTRHAYHHARLALLRADWRPPPVMPIFDFGRAFGFERSPAQYEIHTIVKDAMLPALAIIEAPMGSGKTEAALDTLAHWMRSANLNGVYIAMPTTATSNQMHERVSSFLQGQLDNRIEPLLVHSQALLRQLAPTDAEPATDLDSDTELIEEPEREGDAVTAQSWFLPRKKSLLAPFGVGTVDQALMSVLQTKHFFVRLLGLSHKVVIFDEVHAYDAYMSVLFERLLSWLREIGASVIVLSATLPEKTRAKLVKAYTGSTAAPQSMPYPRLTVAAAQGQTAVYPLTPPPAKTLHYAWLPRDPQAIVEHLRIVLCNGGCAAVICNTVTRAQEIYKAIKKANEDENNEHHLCTTENTILFHARFPMAWREEIETKVLRKFGPNTQDKSKPNLARPDKAIVVATQVIEQSLDLDFDVMISDHAPVDLLLQRAGRLQRHWVNDVKRMHPFCLLITEPTVADGVPKLDLADKLVYDEYVLLRSWLALKQQNEARIELPMDLATLIEQVYGNEPPAINTDAMRDALTRAQQESDRDENNERFKARQRLIRKPSDEELLFGENLDLEEDDPRVHETFQALTRSDRPGLTVVCLHRHQGQLFTEPDGKGMVYDPAQKPSPLLVRELARHVVTIRRPNIEKLLLREPTDREIKQILTRWKKTAALRYHRVAVFENNECHLLDSPYVLRLTKEFGLEIRKETV